MTSFAIDDPVYAAVELGSDSFRLHVARVEAGVLRVAASMAEPVRLAAALDEDGFLGPEAMRRALDCLREFRSALALWRPHAVRVVATSALRIARNAQAFLPAAAHAIGYPVEIIRAEEEGRLVYLGVASTLGAHAERRLVVDVRSASTELVLGRGADVECIESFGVGAVRQSLSFFGGGRLDAGLFDAAVRSARDKFSDAALAGAPRRWSRAYGACGTVRALAGILAEDGDGGPGRLTPASLEALRRRFIDVGHMDRVRRAWPAAANAPYLAGGLALLIALMDEFGLEELAPVHAGLRVGTIWDLHQRGVAQPVAV
jgi:exopolyphosphatase/guanosine-5'-triphosphate,3'-diphosphate pyrophosphatase